MILPKKNVFYLCTAAIVFHITDLPLDDLMVKHISQLKRKTKLRKDLLILKIFSL